MSDVLYKKVGNEYIPSYVKYKDENQNGIDDFFPTDGIWLVYSTNYSKGTTRILLDDLSEAFPFAHLMRYRDDLADFLREDREYRQNQAKTGVNGYKFYPLPSYAEQAELILRFLADKSKER